MFEQENRYRCVYNRYIVNINYILVVANYNIELKIENKINGRSSKSVCWKLRSNRRR